jgi:hypothetical protein
MPYIFEWAKFAKYYAPKSIFLNLLQNPVELLFYVQANKYTGEWELYQSYSKHFITFDNANVYITYNQDGWIFFNVIRVENNQNMGDHMTIGLKDKKRGLVDLHYTVQNTELHHSEKKICFLKDFMMIDNFEEILCANPNGKKMKDHFSGEQLSIMEKIISRPFTIGSKGGSLNKKHLYLVCQQLHLNNYKNKTKSELCKMICE